MEQEEACGDDSSETSEDCVLCLCLRLCKLCIIVCMVRDLPLPHSLRVTFSISNSKHDFFFCKFYEASCFFSSFMRHVLYKTSWSSFQSTNSWFSKVNVLCDRLQG